MTGDWVNQGRQDGLRGLVTRAARTGIAYAAGWTGARWLIKARARRLAGGRRLLVLMYHLPTRGRPEAEGALMTSLCISASTLRRQLQDLGREHEIVSLDDVCRIALEPAPPTRSPAGSRDLAVITFDDGYAGVHEHALPVLAELRIPAVAYVPTGHVGSPRRLLHDRLHACLVGLAARNVGPAASGIREPFRTHLERCMGPTADDTVDSLIGTVPHDALVETATALEAFLGRSEEDLPPATRLMTWGQLRELKAAGVDVGGHTVHHVALAHVPYERARAEIHGCRQDIADHLGSPPRHFSYPNCYYSDAIRREVAAAGFVTATTGPDTTPGPAFDPYAIKRRGLGEQSASGLAGYSSTVAACLFDGVFGALGLHRTAAFKRQDPLEMGAGDAPSTT